jgi:sodium-dependent dicarboxylate transporter 2/3/5
MTSAQPDRTGRASLIGLLLGPVFALVVLVLLPESYADATGQVLELSGAARAAAAIATLMAIWWMSEAIPVYATALLPLALFPVANIMSIHATAASYGHEIIYLFLGGFILALALERWGLHRRLALNVLAVVGSQPRAIVGAFMFVAAVLSMWVTNTATTIMLLPVALSVIALMPTEQKNTAGLTDPFAICLLLGIAYAASIGGMGTIVGTAPNIFVVSFVKEQLGREIGFFEWMRFAVPLVIVFLPLAWLVLTRLAFPVGKQEIPEATRLLREEKAKLPPLSRAEWLTLIIFFLTASAWMTRPLLNRLEIAGGHPLAGLSDPGIAIIAALLLFITPASLRKREFLMNWSTAVKLPWGLLILFGGGLALAAALVETGFSHYLGNLAAGLAGLPVWLIVLIVTGTVVFLTELTSNTATTATIVPILLAVAAGLGLEPLLLIMPAAFAASSAFMLPVATPPNAIVFGSDLLRISQMSRAGFLLNLLAIVLITAASYMIIMPALGIHL